MAEESGQRASGALGKAIRVRRTDLDLKRRDLAERTGLSYPYISEIENGVKHPSDQALARIAEALEMPVSELTALREAYAENLTFWTTESAWRPPVPTADDSVSLRLFAPQTTVGRAQRRVTPLPSPRGVGHSADLADVADVVHQLFEVELERWTREVLPGLVDREVTRVLDEREGRG